MTEQAKVPAIRFAGFTDPWEQRQLGELVTTTIGGGTPSTSNPAYWDGEIPWIQSSNVLEDTLFDVDIPKAITQKGLEESAAQIVPENSIAVVTHVGVGKLIYLPFQYSTSQDFISLCGLKGDARYTCYALWKRLQEDLHIVQGSAIKGITKEDLLEKNLPMPSVEEQAQIGVLFSQLDNLITLHQRKYDKLVIFKKSMLEKMFPKDGESVPEIRFAGFTDPWEQRKLGELFEESDERASDREILSVSVANGIYPASESDRETNPGASLANYKIVHFGDVVYNSMRMWQGAVDASRYDGIVSPAYVVARPNSEVYARFFARLLRQPMLLKQYQQVSQGNSKDTQVLKFDDFASIGISMPASENEQRRIGGFFDRLDSLITLHQRKYDKLVIFKKSMLEKMFPKDGESVPEIRFAGFTDPWEQRELVDIAEIVGGGTPDTNNSNYWDGDIDWYAPAELGNNIYAESSTRKITQAGFDSCSTKMLPADKTILFTSRAGIGNTAILRHSACTNQGFQSLVIGDADVYFVYSMSERIKKWAEEKASGSTFLEISGRQLETMPVNLPSLVEQQAIGSFFSHLDDLITLHQRKLELLQNIKKSLLDKMFA